MKKQLTMWRIRRERTGAVLSVEELSMSKRFACNGREQSSCHFGDVSGKDDQIFGARGSQQFVTPASRRPDLVSLQAFASQRPALQIANMSLVNA
jgi:hypothetical protein